MKLTATLSFALALPSALAHYTFTGLVVNGQNVGRDWQYVRQHQNTYMPTKWKNIPSGSISPDSTDFRCNKGASSANTQTYTVKAGDTVALKQGFGANAIEHPGPSSVYLSKAPGDIKSYNGDGDWFKVYQSLICTPGAPSTLQYGAWCSYGKNNIGFTVPSNLAAGEYLMRVEHIALHGAHDGQAEFYYSCAQIKVEGTSGSGTPTPAVKIPGVYKQNDPAVNFSVWGNKNSYDFIPGVDVVAGGQVEGSPSGSSKAIVNVGGSTGGSTGGSGNGTVGGNIGGNNNATIGDNAGSTAPSTTTSVAAVPSTTMMPCFIGGGAARARRAIEALIS